MTTREENKALRERIEYYSKCDRWGRCHFSLHWVSNYHPGDPAGEHRIAERAQHFLADPIKYGHPRPVEKGGEQNDKS